MLTSFAIQNIAENSSKAVDIRNIIKPDRSRGQSSGDENETLLKDLEISSDHRTPSSFVQEL